MIVPSLSPQFSLTVSPVKSIGLAGGKIIFFILLQPEASVTVTTYSCAGILVISSVVCPESQENRYGEFPPVTVMSIFPLLSPVQFSILTVSLISIEVISEMLYS